MTNNKTSKQAKVLEYFANLKPHPHLKEIVEYAGLASNRSAIDMLKLLASRGLLIAGDRVRDYRLPDPTPVKDFSIFRYTSGGTS